MIKGIIFDFDGTIVDTETPVFQSWSDIYREFNQILPFELWRTIVGTSDGKFDPLDYLKSKINQDVDIKRIKDKEKALENILIAKTVPMPGVVSYLDDARKLGLILGIASSSSQEWVKTNLERMNLAGYFSAITTCEEVTLTKPYPYLFEKTLKKMRLYPYQVIAVEDSPLGVTAAKAAGIFTLAVPNNITREMKLDHADLVLNSLSELSLEELVTSITAG
jgi:HAD superfamily hydrolase (TIGR01509 family)